MLLWSSKTKTVKHKAGFVPVETPSMKHTYKCLCPIVVRPCHDSGWYWMVCHLGGVTSIPDPSLWDKWWESCLGVLHIPPVSINPQMLHTYLFIYHWQYIILAIDGFFNKTLNCTPAHCDTRLLLFLYTRTFITFSIPRLPVHFLYCRSPFKRRLQVERPKKNSADPENIQLQTRQISWL